MVCQCKFLYVEEAEDADEQASAPPAESIASASASQQKSPSLGVIYHSMVTFPAFLVCFNALSHLDP